MMVLSCLQQKKKRQWKLTELIPDKGVEGEGEGFTDTSGRKGIREEAGPLINQKDDAISGAKMVELPMAFIYI